MEFIEKHSQNLPMFVASGAHEDEVRRVVERRGMAAFFTAFYGSPRRKAPIIREILEAHGLVPTTVLFVGDAKADYQAAQDTGVEFVGRVAPGQDNFFPEGVSVISDLAGLEKFL